jgi:hypothetical protein
LSSAPPGTLMFPTAVQADTSLGSVVICKVSEPGNGRVTQAPSISTSARTPLTERIRLEILRMGMDVSTALLLLNCLLGGVPPRKTLPSPVPPCIRVFTPCHCGMCVCAHRALPLSVVCGGARHATAGDPQGIPPRHTILRGPFRKLTVLPAVKLGRVPPGDTLRHYKKHDLGIAGFGDDGERRGGTVRALAVDFR